tara:strand:- start:1178 stop:1309 length:132 start_codon:yes stop_codon:yes gene_type:complete
MLQSILGKIKGQSMGLKLAVCKLAEKAFLAPSVSFLGFVSLLP